MLVYLLKTSLLPTLFFFLLPRMSFNYPKAFEKKTDVTSWSFYWAMSSRDRGGKLGAMSLKAREGFTKKCISSHLALTLITWYFSNLKCLYNFLPCRNFLFLKKRSTFIFLTNFFECILKLIGYLRLVCKNVPSSFSDGYHLPELLVFLLCWSHFLNDSFLKFEIKVEFCDVISHLAYL